MKSFGGRLPLLFVALTGSILTVFSASLFLWVREGLTRDLERDLESRTFLFRQRLQEEYSELLRGIHSDIRPELEDFVRAAGITAEVRRADGTTFWASEGFSRGRPDHLERVDSVPVRDGGTFSVTLTVSEERIRAPLRQLAMYTAIFLPVTLIIAWIIGNLFIRKAFAPVEEIRRHAERISRANMSERVPETGSIREIQDLARTFNEMLGRLDNAIQDLQNFAADAAHELRTPLANLRAEIDTAVQHVLSPEDYQRILGSFGEEVARMNHIVTDLFTLAKIDMRQYALQKERVGLLPLLEEARETWQVLADARKVRVGISGPDVQVAGDPVALRRVFMNLVENAIKYNREGGEVAVSIDRADGRARVRIADTGIGIPAEHLPRLFRRFYRIDKARSRESGGAGLGLAISRAFIEAHEGAIRVESSVGKGTTFTVELPVLG